jgi:hypothetical protein
MPDPDYAPDYAHDAQAERPILEELHRYLGSYLRYPGHGLPERQQNTVPRMPGWSRLAKDAPLGQKTNIFYNPHVNKFQTDPVQILQLPGDEGTDLDATQIQLVLAPPRAIPREVIYLPADIQGMTGEFDNAAMASFGTYPGGIHPIAWPPFIYVVEWGVGGTRVRAEIDAVNGASVNLTASFVRVYGAVALDAIEGAPNPGTEGVYTLAAFVGPGFPREGSAQRTVFLGELTAAGTPDQSSEIFATPPLAKDVTVLSNAGFGNVTAGYVTFSQDPGGLNPVATYFVNGNQPGSFRVPNGGAYFQVQSGLGVSAYFSAVFGLSI